jgi:hypothetical protein
MYMIACEFRPGQAPYYEIRQTDNDQVLFLFFFFITTPSNEKECPMI